MEKLKRAFKLMGFILLVILASVGLGFMGAVPISSRKDEAYYDNEIKIELVESKEDEESDEKI